MTKQFKPLEIVIAHKDITGTSIKRGNGVLYLGEIPNMPGHIAFADSEGKVYWGYHPDNFRKVKEEEI